MDSKIVKFTLIFCFIFFNVNAAEFKGKFIQGHFIIGQTEPNSKIIIDKKEIKVSKNGFFVFGIDRDRKFDILITKISNGKKEKIIRIRKRRTNTIIKIRKQIKKKKIIRSRKKK